MFRVLFLQIARHDTREEEREPRRCVRTEWNGRRVEDGKMGEVIEKNMDGDYWPFLCWFFYLANVLACFCDVGCPCVVVVCLLVTLVMVCF